MAYIVNSHIGLDPQEVIIENNNMYYITNNIKIYFQLEREKAITAYTNPQLRVTIYSGSRKIGGTDFLPSSSDKKGYDYAGDTAAGWILCPITTYSQITKVKIEAKTSAGDIIFENFDLSKITIYEEISIQNNHIYFGNNRGTFSKILPQTYFDKIEKRAKIFGTSDNFSSYKNEKYYTKYLLLELPLVQYLSTQAETPDECSLYTLVNNEEKIIKTFAPTQKTYNIILNKEQIENQSEIFYIKYRKGGAEETEQLSLTPFPGAQTFFDRCATFSNDFIRPNKVSIFNQEQQLQIILLKGEIIFKDASIYPYVLTNIRNFKFHFNDDIVENITTPIINFNEWVFSENKISGEIGDNDCFISLEIYNNFLQNYEEIKIKLDKTKTFNYYEKLEVLPEVLITKIGYNEKIIENPLIINQGETLYIDYDQTKIFVPHLRRFLTIDDNYDIYYHLFSDRYTTEDGVFTFSEKVELTTKNTITYSDLYETYNKEQYPNDNYKETKTTLFSNLFLKIEMFNKETSENFTNIPTNPNEIDELPILKIVQMGRTTSPTFSSYYFNDTNLILNLSDYGGDKNESYTYFDFHKQEYSSLYRNIGENIKIILHEEKENINTGEPEILTSSITIPIINNQFWKENSNIEIALSSLENVNFSKIIQIDFEYYYSLNQSIHIDFKAIPNTTEKYITYRSPRPNISHRKNGFIINGTPGQQLSDKEFIQINILDTDKEISFYVNDSRVGGIKYINGKLHLSGFVID